MIIEFKNLSQPVLEEAYNFQAFKIVVHEYDSDQPLQYDLTTIGWPDDDGTHVWVDAAWFHANGPQAPEWRAGFDKMLAYAARHGWVNNAGNIRAHLQFISPS